MKHKITHDEDRHAPAKPAAGRGEVLIAIGLLLAVTLISFYPSLGNGFTNWDDHLYVTDNKMIRSLSPENIKTIFTSFDHLYQPLVFLSFACEYHFFRLDPRIYHATNLVLHGMNTLLLFWILLLLSRNPSLACASALLFSVHPLRVQSVAWVVERKDLLYALFFLMALVSHLYYREKKSAHYYYISLCLFALSLMAKPMGATLPFIMLLFDSIVYRKSDRTTFIEKIPFIILSLLIVSVTLPHQVQRGFSTTLAHNVSIASYVMLLYLSKIVAPLNLSFYYLYPDSLKTSLPAFFLIFPFLAAAFVAALVAARRRFWVIAFGGFFYLITLLPVMQLIPITGTELIAERYTYIPSIGITSILGAALCWLHARMERKLRLIPLALFVIIIGLFSSVTWQRCGAWKDSETFWNDVLARDPNNHVAYNNLGTYDTSKGDYDRGLAHLNRAIALDPGYAEAYHNRANILFKTGKLDKALADYTMTLELGARFPKTYNNRGNLYLQTGAPDKACADYTKALELDPNFAEAYCNRGFYYAARGDYQKALADYTRALEIEPGKPSVYLNRGDMFRRKGDLDKAIADYNSLIALDPKCPEAYNGLGQIYDTRRDYRSALADYDKALALAPNFADAHINRGITLMLTGNYTPALRELEKALELEPGNIKAYRTRVFLFFVAGDYDGAWSDVHKLHSMGQSVEPDFMKKLRSASGRVK
jgi:protein O-mannosyl-transferase